MKLLRIFTGTGHFPPNRRMLIAVLAVVFVALTGCDEIGSMRDQPRYDPLEASDLFEDGRSARPIQPGTVPYSADLSPNRAELTGLDESGEQVNGFPVEVNQELLALGQERYDIYCTPCHGPAGEGNGRVTGFGYPKPPSLLADDARGLTTGAIFNIITNGQGVMYPYAYRVKPDERWAVIAYIRAMQLRNGQVDPQEITPDELNQIGQQQ